MVRVILYKIFGKENMQKIIDFSEAFASVNILYNLCIFKCFEERTLFSLFRLFF